nr:hypothetical protein [Tanacetum cinerariifolium]
MAIPTVMLNDEIKASAEYSEYLAKSKGLKPVKIRGKCKGLLSKEGVEVFVDRVTILKRRRSKTVVEEVGQSTEVADDIDSEETKKDEEPQLVEKRQTGVVIGGEAYRESDEKGVDHSKKLKGIEMLSEAAQFNSSEGSGVAPEVPDGLSHKGTKEGSGVTSAVPDKLSDNSSISSSDSEDEIKDILTDEADDIEKVADSMKADDVIDVEEQAEEK